MTRELDESAGRSGPERVERVRSHLGHGSDTDRVLISSEEDLRWLCGFTGSHGWLLIGHHDVKFLTDGRYVDQARLESDRMGLNLEVVQFLPGENVGGIVARACGPNLGRVFFQARSMNVAQYQELQSLSDVELVPAPSEFERLRRFKDDEEVSLIARAAEIADRALAEVVPMLTERPTERDVRDELEYRMRRLGADGPSYETIVATGPVNSAKPHHRPDTTIIEEGHSVVIDVGALVDGYHSDMTRTYLIGDVDPELTRFYDLVRQAQSAAVAQVRPGVECRLVDEACRSVFQEHGVEDLFIHGVGHGVGLAIHEEPFVGRMSGATLESGDVVTVEPGLYRMGLGGVRIEDLLVVTSHGHRCLSSLPKDSPCLPSPRTI